MSIRKYWPITENDVYVRVFDEILKEIDHSFFDKELIESYQRLRPECRYLLTRSYIRTAKWIRKEQYERYMAPETVCDVTKELVEAKWLMNEPPLDCLITDVASQRELQDVAKSLGLKKAANMARPKLAEQLIQLEKQQAFFNSGRIATKISESLNIDCYFLPPERRQFFFKLEQMFLFPVGPDATLETIYLTHMKKHSFYGYKYLSQREAPLFNSCESFDAYAKARALCNPIEEALALVQRKVPEFLTSAGNLQMIECGLQDAVAHGYSQAARCYGRGIYNISQVFMKVHRFIDEYAWVQKYLDQTAHKSKRGVTLIRKLLLELRFLDESHTNGESSWLVGALNTYYDAIAEVSDIEMLDLQRKTLKLQSSIRNTGLKSALSAVQSDATSPRPKHRIPIFEIYAVPSTVTGVTPGQGTRVTYADGVGVEQLALIHYEGYKGGHYENSMMLTILWLLCYDLLFSDPDQFRCAYQYSPMNTQKAITDHKDEILRRMNNIGIKKTVMDNRKRLVEECGEVKPYVGGINWFIPETSISAVISGLGHEKLSIILNRIMLNYRKYSSGFPDLTIWDANTCHTKFVEVKSENDTVSDNQLLWMEFLLENGIDVEICKVIPEKRGPKRKRG